MVIAQSNNAKEKNALFNKLSTWQNIIYPIIKIRETETVIGKTTSLRYDNAFIHETSLCAKYTLTIRIPIIIIIFTIKAVSGGKPRLNNIYTNNKSDKNTIDVTI